MAHHKYFIPQDPPRSMGEGWVTWGHVAAANNCIPNIITFPRNRSHSPLEKQPLTIETVVINTTRKLFRSRQMFVEKNRVVSRSMGRVWCRRCLSVASCMWGWYCIVCGVVVGGFFWYWYWTYWWCHNNCSVLIWNHGNKHIGIGNWSLLSYCWYNIKVTSFIIVIKRFRFLNQFCG